MSIPNEQEIGDSIDAIFDKYDVDKSKTLDFPEIRNVLTDAFQQLGATRSVTDDDVKKLIGAVDKNHDYKITKQELH